MTPKQPMPPRWAEQFLEWYCDPRLLEDLQGDLHERFITRTKSLSLLRSRLLYIWDVIVFLRPYTVRKTRKPSFLFLFKSYIKPSVRILSQNKLHTGLNIFGLTISVTAFILITLYVQDELKYDRHYDKSERIYKVTSEVISPTANTYIVATDGYLGQRLKDTCPEVEESVEMIKLSGKSTVRHKGAIFLEDKLYRAEGTYFKIFSHTWVAGNPENALVGPGKIVLTRKLAEKYFEKEAPLNKTISIGENDFVVTGVIENLPPQTDLKFDGLLSTEGEYLVETDYWCVTFILVGNKINIQDFEKKLNAISKDVQEHEVGDTEGTLTYHIEALPDVHFGKPKKFDTPKSNRSNIYIFSVVAFFILLMACVNYTNLAIVQVLKRSTSAGIRKILGALPSQLVKQFLFEFLILCSFSFSLAVTLSYLFLPYLNQLTGKDISATEMLSYPVRSLLALVIILISLCAGLYPAIVMASVKPSHSIAGHIKLINANRFRNGLIVFQFTMSITLAICTKIIYDQWNVLTQSNPGFNKEQVLVIDVPAEDSATQLMITIKNEFAALPFVKTTSLVGYNSLPTSSMDVDGYDVEYLGKNTTKIFNNITIDESYVDLLEIDVVRGRNFTPQEVENNNGAILVNESLVNAVGWKNPIGQTLYCYSEAYEIIGVVKDFHFNSFHKTIEPIVIHGNHGHPEKFLVKVNQASLQNIQLLVTLWKKINKRPFSFEFLDSYFTEQYKNERTMQNVLQYFTAFTLVISCLGLFGLVALSTAQRTKEFGIRKVLGARFSTIAILVLKGFLLRVVLGATLSIPIAWWSITIWLEQFAYKTTLAVADFILPILLTLGIAMLSTIYHTTRASRINPVESIKQG